MNSIYEILQLFALYQHRIKTRQALLQLNSDQLDDIGLTREQAIDEASRPFWSGNSAFFEKSLRDYNKEKMKRFICSYPKNRANYRMAA